MDVQAADLNPTINQYTSESAINLGKCTSRSNSTNH